jgi:uncharacterized SAM-binding protein YcdF (DUF218 family)
LRLVLRLLAVVIGLALAGAISLAAIIVVYGGQTDPGPADAAIVLGAATYDTEPSPVFAERLRHAANLYESGRVRAIVVTGGLAKGKSFAEAEAGRDWLIANGVPAEAIVVEAQSRTTRENLVFTQPLLAEKKLQSVLVVSDPLHMRRSMWIAEALGINAQPSPTPTTRYQSLGTQIPMLAREVWFTLTFLLTGV